MSRKLLFSVAVSLVVGALGYAVVAQVPQHKSQWDRFQPTKAGKRWQYCTLTEVVLDEGRINVIFEGGGLSGVADGGWIQLAERLGAKLAPEHPRKNDRWHRQDCLDQMGLLGWELVNTHRGEQDRIVWVFKREQ
jgi:hypothetical protein